MNVILNTIEDRITAIDLYISDHGYLSFDPYDGLSSSWIRHFLGKNQLFERIWLQAIRLFPINIRPLLGIRTMVHTKAVSDFASAYCLLYQLKRNKDMEDKSRKALDLLLSITSSTRTGLGWGLRFPFATRFVHASAEKANIFQTINAIQSFLEGYETFGEKRYLEIAVRGFLFLKNDLGFKETETMIYWNYWEGLDVQIYNISGLMIGLCSRMWVFTKQEIYRTYALKLYNYIKSVQNPEGLWFYAGDEKGKFIDGFHSGYILEGIIRGVLSGVLEKEECLRRGIEAYLRNFFDDDLTPKYYQHSTYPLDGQNLAQALQTLQFIFNVNFVAKSRVIASFERVDSLLWNKRGYYNYKKSRWLTYTTPMHRWVTGPFFLALAYIRNDTGTSTHEAGTFHPE